LFYFEKLDEARRALELPEEATLEEIRRAYRRKVLQLHPDRKREQRCREYRKEMVQVNKAYQIIRDYIREYRFSFKKEEAERYDPDRDMTRFSKYLLKGRR